MTVTSLAAPRYTSVPRSSRANGDFRTLSEARSLILVLIGETARGSVDAIWDPSDRPDVPTCVVELPTADDTRELNRVLSKLTVGVRFLIVGAEADAFLVRSRVLQCGGIDDEMCVIVTADAERRVYCAHCRTTSRASASVGDVVVCAGCERSLVIYHHFSRSMAAYLGFEADAEDAS